MDKSPKTHIRKYSLTKYVDNYILDYKNDDDDDDDNNNKGSKINLEIRSIHFQS